MGGGPQQAGQQQQNPNQLSAVPGSGPSGAAGMPMDQLIRLQKQLKDQKDRGIETIEQLALQGGIITPEMAAESQKKRFLQQRSQLT